jgi:hypothetical protein
MNLQRRVQEAIDDCNKAFLKHIPASCAARFSSLIEAEEDRIISRQWRRHIDVDRVEALIHANPGSIQSKSEGDYSHLKAVLEFDGKLIYEEAMLVLTLRSDLQLLARFSSITRAATLSDVDELLLAAIKHNPSTIQQCRARKTIGLEASLPRHWWWRMNTPPLVA